MLEYGIGVANMLIFIISERMAIKQDEEKN